ncbi:MAG: hypothetical protein KAX38_00940 [Candidatus Krumholzibacteria bacterium]|nr:hypothetical protein [Candidatus Krumholzibacteria bacterium]
MQKKSSFLLDRMLGKLCRKLRLLGYDARLNPADEMGRFLLTAECEGRIAVTLSRRRHDRPGPQPVILKKGGVIDQIEELFNALGEKPKFEPFTRCLECNTPLAEEPPSSVHREVPPYIAKTFHHYNRCPDCRRLYWEGSHFQAMAEEIKEIEARFDR